MAHRLGPGRVLEQRDDLIGDLAAGEVLRLTVADQQLDHIAVNGHRASRPTPQSCGVFMFGAWCSFAAGSLSPASASLSWRCRAKRR